MPLPSGTRVWVRCEDKDWWPARVCATPSTLTSFATGAEDCCVEFYHNPGQLYPIVSSDVTRLQPLHIQSEARSAAERSWFANPRVDGAVRRLMQDITGAASSSITSAPSPPPLVSSYDELSVDSLSASELRNIQSLLGAVSTNTAEALRARLQGAGMRVTPGAVQRQQAHELARRKRVRTVTSQPAHHESVRVKGAPPGPVPCKFPVRAPAVFAAHVSALRPTSPPCGAVVKDDHAGPCAASMPIIAQHTPQPAAVPTAPVSTSSPPPFVRCVDDATLAVLRAEVFECAHKFVLSPVYRFLDLLGAVTVGNEGVRTTLPSPHATRSAPQGGFDRGRRVLLVALSEDYDHTVGWMPPVELDGCAIRMRLAVNAHEVAVPENWSVAPARAARAVRTAPVADITALVLPGTAELFTLTVDFSNAPPDTELWRGLVVCVYAEERPLASLGEEIVSHYRTPRPPPPSRQRRRSRAPSGGSEGETVRLTEGAVRVRCPVTTLPMEVPVRGVHCEHLQCMELAAVLIQCAHSNVWNCPLCYAAMTPSDMCVNYRLKDWLSVNRGLLHTVDYVIETPPGQPLRVQFLKPRQQTAAETIDLCED